MIVPDELDTLQARQQFPRTDLGNAERFALRNQHIARFVHGWGWFRWDGRRWAADDQRRVERLAADTVRSMLAEAATIQDLADRTHLAKHALQSERVERLGAMLKLAASMDGVALTTQELDANPHLLNVENGTIDLRTGQLRYHDREQLITKLAPVRFDPAAKAPTWDAFIHWAFLGRPELIRFIQRALGYCITGLTREQVWMLFWGTGRNGKTTLLEILEEIMGDYAVRAMPDVFLGKAGHPTELAALAGSRLALAIEPEIGKPFRDGLLKAITGEARMTARRMHGNPFTFPVTFKIVMAANHRPPARDTSDGFWRRVRLVPFEAQVSDAEKDPGLKDKLRAEAPGILAWIVRGAVEWYAMGLGTAPEVDAATRRYREEQDQLRRFIEEECVLSGDAWVLTTGLYSAFREWCDRTGEPAPTRSDFIAQVERVDGVREVRRGYGRGYAGLALRAREPDPVTR